MNSYIASEIAQDSEDLVNLWDSELMGRAEENLEWNDFDDLNNHIAAVAYEVIYLALTDKLEEL